MKNLAVTGCICHSSRSFKGYVNLFIYKQFIITVELNRIETLNWVKRPFSRMGVSALFRAYNKNRHDRGKKEYFSRQPIY